jgi:Uma2 family endonuclease
MAASNKSNEMTRKGSANEAVKLTYDDFLLFRDDGKRHELIDGEHYVTASPNTKHQRVSGNLHYVIRSWLEQHQVGRIFYAPFDILFSRFDVVEPDLLFISNERIPQILTEQHVTGAPDLIIEIDLPPHGSATRRLRDGCTTDRVFRSTGWSIRSWMLSACTVAVSMGLRRRLSSPTKPVMS